MQFVRTVAISGFCAALIGMGPVAKADAASPVVVELFTSQSCSSCPPADAFLGDLAKRPDVLPLAFHVDYWNNINWKDPYSSHEATSRQRDYARTLGLDNVYTPQIVVNGRVDAVGSDRLTVNAAIASVPKQTVSVTLFAVNDTLSIMIGSGSGQARLWLVTFDHRHETNVRSGENAGRKLSDINAVRSIEPFGTWHGEKLALSSTFPRQGSGVALLVQGDDGKILGAGSINGPE